MSEQSDDLSMSGDEIEKRHKLRAWEVRHPKTRAEAESAIKLARGILANIDAAEPRVENGYHRLEIARVSWQQKLDELLYALECITSDETGDDKRGQEKQYRDLAALTLYVLRQWQFRGELTPLAVGLRARCERALPRDYFDTWIQNRLSKHEAYAHAVNETEKRHAERGSDTNTTNTIERDK